MFVPVRTSASYVQAVPHRAFGALSIREFNDPSGTVLSTEMDKLPGVSRADYNGHFGNNIFYDVEASADTPETHVAVSALIQRHLYPRKFAGGSRV